MAISIMIYHLTGGVFFANDSSVLLGRLGIYGVSIFFILSGLSMSIVYSNYIVDAQTAVFFFIRRIFRIWPLLWICIFLALVPLYIQGESISIISIIANMTTVFGFIKPDAYINTGAWSIGNEMVYYSLTPIVIGFYSKNKIYGNLFVFLSFVMSVIFSFYLLKSSDTIASQWVTYVNPFNNLFLYASGIAIFYNLNTFKIGHVLNLCLFLIPVLFFLYYPVSGDQIHIVTGWNRLMFMFFSIIFVISFYKFDLYQYAPKVIAYPLELFGVATYGVYLLHPIIALYLKNGLKLIGIDNVYLVFTITCILTVIIALISYNVYETKLMAIGKRLTNKEGGFMAFLESK